MGEIEQASDSGEIVNRREGKDLQRTTTTTVDTESTGIIGSHRRKFEAEENKRKRRRSLEYDELMLRVDQERNKQATERKIKVGYSSSEEDEEKYATKKAVWRQ